MGRKSAISLPQAHEAASRYRPGDVVAERYQLIRPLGEGGMGIVWVAHSLALDVDVAFKVIAADLAGTDAAERMAQEARAAARLGHPAMVRVMDFGITEHGDPYLVMELLHGEMLSDILERDGRLSAIEAVRMLLPIADGLATAHDAGIVHRDLKPDNVFVARDNIGRIQPKLLDFGIAKLQDTDLDRKITAMGAVLGSPDYMSPEQAHGRDDIDHRSDVWAFCVVLYEAITGAVPFNADNYNGLMFTIINHEPEPSTNLGAGDADLWRVLERGLRKGREERWDSMWELGQALALWAYEQGVKEDVTKRSIKGSWLDAGLSGVQVIVSPTVPPERPTDPEGVRELDPLLAQRRQTSVPSMAIQTRPARAPTRPAPPPRRAKRSGRALLLGVLFAVAGLATFLAAALVRPDALPSVAVLLTRLGLQPVAVQTPTSDGETAMTPVVSPAVMPLLESPSEAAPPQAPPAEEPTGQAPAEHNAADPVAPSAEPVMSSAPAEPAPVPKVPRPLPRKRPKPARDFGF
jgi:serine/threonine-protein kinase